MQCVPSATSFLVSFASFVADVYIVCLLFFVFMCAFFRASAASHVSIVLSGRFAIFDFCLCPCVKLTDAQFICMFLIDRSTFGRSNCRTATFVWLCVYARQWRISSFASVLCVKFSSSLFSTTCVSVYHFSSHILACACSIWSSNTMRTRFNAFCRIHSMCTR